MSEATLGRITSEPNEYGEHSLKCPKCDKSFLSKITKDDVTGALNNAVCPVCGYGDEPKFFIAAAHQSDINGMAMEYATKELRKVFKKFK